MVCSWRGSRSGDDKWATSGLGGGQYCQDFQGSFEDVITVSNVDNFPRGSSDRTFQVWIRKNGFWGDMALLQYGCWTGCQGWNMGVHRDGHWLYMDLNGCDCEWGGDYDGDCNSVRDMSDVSHGPMNDGEWHQIVMAYEGVRHSSKQLARFSVFATHAIRMHLCTADPRTHLICCKLQANNHYKSWIDGQVLVDHQGGGRVNTCSPDDYNNGQFRMGSQHWTEDCESYTPSVCDATVLFPRVHYRETIAIHYFRDLSRADGRSGLLGYDADGRAGRTALQ